MHPLFELYGKQSPDFINGIIAALEYYAGESSRISLYLYGRPITREVLELEKKGVLNAFTDSEEEVPL